MARFVSILIVLFLSPIRILPQQYEGEVQETKNYNPSGDSKDSFKTIWYCSSLNDYREKETENYNNHNVGFYTGAFTEVCSKNEEQMLNSLQIETGFYTGEYYPSNADSLAPILHKNYLAYFSVPLDIYSVYISFMGVNRKYNFNYTLEPERKNKNKLAFFRIPSGKYNDPEDYRISVAVTENNITIKSVYNHQKLTVKLTPIENLYKTYARKWGFYDEPRISLIDSTMSISDKMENLKE